MKITCTRSLGFDAGHRVVLHESKCKYLHGHRYTVEATFEAEKGLDAVGRVVDFGVIKARLGVWLDTHWDHTVILWEKDKPLGDSIAHTTGQTIYYLPVNPTAENMAAYLLHNVCPALFTDTGLACTRVRLYETPNCFADACA